MQAPTNIDPNSGTRTHPGCERGWLRGKGSRRLCEMGLFGTVLREAELERSWSEAGRRKRGPQTRARARARPHSEQISGFPQEGYTLHMEGRSSYERRP
jgi:hypothetical protein